MARSATRSITTTPGDGYDPEEISDDLGDEWAIRDIGYKPYPSDVIKAPGSPSNLASDERLRRKFLECVEARFERKRAENLADTVEPLQKRPLSELTRLARGD